MKKVLSAIGTFCRKFTIIPILIVIFVVFSACTDKFFSFTNMLNILQQSSIYGPMALGMTFLIICGYFDLSAGVVMGFTANLVVLFQIKGCSIPVAIIITLAVAFVIGLVNGILVTKVHINAFIVTLAMMIAGRGLTYVICKGDQIGSPNIEFMDYANGKFHGVSYLTITFAILLIIAAVVMKYTKHGRDTFAIGGNTEAAFNSGIKVDKVKTINFIICSFAAGIGGIMTASRMNAATPYLGYPDGAIMIITCVVLGGTGLQGGYGGPLYTLGGTVAYFMFRNGLNMMNVTTAYYYMLTGVILIAIVTLDKIQDNRRNRKVLRKQ